MYARHIHRTLRDFIFMEQEIWKPIKGYEGLYEISNLGIVRNKRKQIRKLTKDKYGYMRLSLCKNGKHKGYTLHRLLMDAFVENIDNKPQIDHIDGNKLNNSLSNLRYVTQKENLNNPNTKGAGWKNNNKDYIVSKILNTRIKNGCKYAPMTIYAYNTNGSFFRSFPSINEAGRYFNVTPKKIQVVLDDNSKIACGYLWSKSLSRNHKYIPQKSKRCKSVIEIDKGGNIVNRWDSIKALSKSINAHSYITLARHIKNRITYNGHLYVYE